MEKNQMDIKQIRQETEAWKRILGFLQQENIVQKTKLGEMLRSEERNEDVLEEVEQYQNRFLQQDEAFKLMMTDISKLEKLVMFEDLIHDHGGKQIEQQEKRLNKEMLNLQSNFNHLRSEFLHFIES